MEEKINTILLEQLELLREWNNKNIAFEPEQTRKNIETILNIASNLIPRNNRINF